MVRFALNSRPVPAISLRLVGWPTLVVTRKGQQRILRGEASAHNPRQSNSPADSDETIQLETACKCSEPSTVAVARKPFTVFRLLVRQAIFSSSLPNS
jgi:hypothetical protein